jgi:hypothetical protein
VFSILLFCRGWIAPAWTQDNPQHPGIVPPQRVKPPEPFLRFQERVERARYVSNSPAILDSSEPPKFTARVEAKFKVTLPEEGSPEEQGVYRRIVGTSPSGPLGSIARRYELRTEHYAGEVIVDGNKNVFEKNWRNPEDCAERDRDPKHHIGCRIDVKMVLVRDALAYVLGYSRTFFAQYPSDHFEEPLKTTTGNRPSICVAFSRGDSDTHEDVKGRGCFDEQNGTLLEYQLGGWREQLSNYILVGDTLQPTHIAFYGKTVATLESEQRVTLEAEVSYSVQDGPFPIELLSPTAHIEEY